MRPRAVSHSFVDHHHQTRAGRGLHLRRFDLRVRGLHPAHQGLRIAHLTDIHVGMMTPRRRILRAVELAREAEPHLTVLTGDFLGHGRRFVPVLGRLLAGLPGAVVAVLGNHDYWTSADGVAGALESNGYHVLRNEHRSIEVGGAPVHVVGIDDAITRHDDVDLAFARVPRPEGGRAPAGFAGRGGGIHPPVRSTGTTIALTHAPNLADHAVARGAQLVFAGHTHGGQIRIPRVTERIAARVSSRYLAGFYPVGDGILYVGCGVGYSGIPLRAGAPAEVAILTLRSA